MVRVNCASIPKELYESEFFGHEKGSFTGATGERKGYFEVTDGGTIFLDEIGEMYTSEKFAVQLNKLQMQGSRRIIFLVAGAFGADEKLKQRADKLLSLSKMTFSHQMIRLFFLEQLYRAFTILRNEKYHNS